MKGRVAVLRDYGGEFELREYPVPEVEPGAILVRLTRAGICGSDLHIWRGEMKGIYGAIPNNLTFGHEMCGRVERLGAGVTTDSAGKPLRADREAGKRRHRDRRSEAHQEDRRDACEQDALRQREDENHQRA